MKTDAVEVKPPSQVPFVGRTKEIDLLRSCLEKAKGGEPQVVLLSGDAGMGKSRLAGEAVALAEGLGFQTVIGRCIADGPIPFMPFSTAFVERLSRARVLNKDALGPGAAVLAGYLSNGASRSPTSDDENRAELVRAIPRGLFALAERRPALLVLDDLQWADQDALTCFHHLVLALSDEQRHRQVRAMIVAIYRDPPEDAVAKVLDRLVRESIVLQINLRGLAEIEAAALVQGASGSQCSPGLLGDLMEATWGNPLLVIESLDALARRNALAIQADRLDSTDRMEDIPLASEVHRAARERVQATPAFLAETLVVASLLGEEFSVAELALAAGEDSNGVLRALEQATELRLLAARGKFFGFSHPTLRRAFIESVLLPRRQRLHLDIALRLERSGRTDPATVAQIGFHYLAAEGEAAPAAAGPAIVRAGDKAVALGATDRAARLFDGALALADYAGSLPSAELASLECRCGLAHGRNGDTAKARERFAAAMARAQAAGEIELWGEALVGWAKTYTITGSRLSPSAFDEFLAAANEARMPAVRARVLTVLADVLWLLRDPADLETAREAVRLAVQSGEPLAEANASVTLGMTRMRAFDLEGAVEAFQAAQGFARGVDSASVRAWGPVRLAMAQAGRGDLRATRAAAEDGEAESRNARDWGQLATVLGTLSTVATLEGQYDEAERAGGEAVLCLNRSMYRAVSSLVFSALAWNRVLTGRWDAARDALSEWKRWGGASPAWLFDGFAPVGGGSSGTGDAAFPGPAPWQRGIDINTLGATAMVPHFCAATGCTLPADFPTATLLEAHRQGVRFVHSPPLNVLRAAGVAELLAGRAAEGADLIARAIAECREAGATSELALGLTDRGRAEVALSRHGDATASIGEALTMFEELGAWGAHEHAMKLARAHGLELAPRSRAPVYPAGLTEDAMLVLTAFAAGKSLSVVAGELVMDERTVERLLDDARERAQVKTPGAAAEWLDRHGLALTLSRTTGRGSGGLSAREIEVIGLIAVGRTNQQIADELVISLHTVARHVANIFDKTGAANRTEAVHFATTHGVALPLSRTTGSTDTGVRRSVDLAFLFEDIRGSSVLNEALGDDRYYELLALHNEELEGAIARHGGAVVKHTGDGYFATFPDTAAALAGALDIESRFPLALWGEPESVMRIAVGVHAGGGVAARGDVYGIAVAKTSRICALAAGGEVLVSELARHRAPEGRFRFVDRGGVSLKGFSGPMRIYQVFPR